MLNEIIVLLSFFGLIGIIVYQILFFIVPRLFESSNNQWMAMLAFCGILFFGGLFFVTYFASFNQETTITSTDGTIFTIENNDWYYLTPFATIAQAAIFVGAVLGLCQIIVIASKNAINFAKGSNV